MWWLLACTTAPDPAPAVDPEAVLAALDLGALTVERDVVADPGRLDDGEWVGDPLEDGVTLNGAPLRDGRAHLSLPWGRSVVRVRRSCGEVAVGVEVGAAAVVSVPFPACAVARAGEALPSGVMLDRWERSWGEVYALVRIGVIAEVAPPPPGEAAAPARYVDRATAEAVCAFWGGRLPTLTEWRAAGGGEAPRSDPGGPLAVDDPGASERFAASGVGDLDGGVSEWVGDAASSVQIVDVAGPAKGEAGAAGEGSDVGAGGRTRSGATPPERDATGYAVVVGASWLRTDALRIVPASARTDEIGFRCAFSGPAPG